MAQWRDVDGGWAWFVLGASYFNILLCSGLGYLAGVYQVVFLEHFHGSVALTSWVTSLFSSLMQLGGPLSSVIANKFSCRTSVMLGGCFMTFGLFLSGLSEDLVLLFVSFGLLAGIGLGLIYTSSVVVISFFFDRHRRLVNGFATSGGGLGIFLAPHVSQILFDNFNWRESLFILAGISAHVCVAGALMYSMRDKNARNRNCQTCRGAFRCRFRNGESDYNGDELCTFVRDRKETDSEVRDIDDCTSHHHIRKNVYNPDIDNNDDVRMCDSGNQSGKDNRTSDIAKSLVSQTVRNNTSLEALETGPFLYPVNKGSLDKENANYSKRFELEKTFSTSDNFQIEPNRKASTPPTEEIKELPDQSLPQVTKSFFPALKNNSNNSNTESNNYLYRSNLENSLDTEALFQTTLDHQCNDPEVSVIFSKPFAVNGPNTVNVNSLECSGSSNNVENTREGKILTLQGNVSIHTESRTASDSERDDETKDPSSHQPPPYRNRCFWMLCLSLFISNAGCGIFNIHVPSFLKSQGLTEHEVTNVLSINGLAIVCGRCLMGALANNLPGDDLLLFMIMHIIGGLAICLMPVLGTSALPNMLIIFVIGSYAGTVYAVLPTLTIRYVGLGRLATAFGIEMVSAGLGYLVSPPLAGIIVDLTDTYTYNIGCGGFLFILGGLVLMVLPSMEHNKQASTVAMPTPQ